MTVTQQPTCHGLGPVNDWNYFLYVEGDPVAGVNNTDARVRVLTRPINRPAGWLVRLHRGALQQILFHRLHAFEQTRQLKRLWQIFVGAEIEGFSPVVV